MTTNIDLTPYLTDGDEQLHVELAKAAVELHRTVDRTQRNLEAREARFTKVSDLRDEMRNATEAFGNSDTPTEHRALTQIASELTKANNAIDKEMDKVFADLATIETLRTRVSSLAGRIDLSTFTADFQ